MAKMNYSNFKEDECEIVPVESVEFLPSNTTYDLSNNSSSGSAQALASAVSPVVAITNCINVALDTVSTISKCIAIVSIEKQKTAQVKATMKMKIEESKQQTERVNIHEKEKTKRLIINCESDLKAKKLELEKLRDEYKYKNNERKISYNEYVETLDLLRKQVDDLIKDKELIRNILLKESTSLQNETNLHSLTETYLHSLNEVNTKLVEISSQIISLKGR